MLLLPLYAILMTSDAYTVSKPGSGCRDSFFSINRGRSAYSGTATFCRKGVADARAAQEGVTGISLSLKLDN